MKLKKIFVLLPDGVGLRNFAFTSFVEIGIQMGWEVVFWNQTPFNLTELGFAEIKLESKPRSYTDLLKRAKINSELDYFEEKFNDEVYQTYKFSKSYNGLKSKIKDVIVSQISKTYRGEKGLNKLREKLKVSERKSPFYKDCKAVLLREKPDFIFCTNQRSVNAIAPLTAAQDINISTGTFIFSWDNLPKATMIVEPDFYFTWSEYMKRELLKYYPYVDSEKIFITGSPQFEPHFNHKLRKTREEFFSENNLDLKKEYVCYSGDDKTTCPDDAHYLQDVAEAVESLNKNREIKLGILFRRCPVDFSNRYESVLKKYKELIVPIAPKWTKIGNGWDNVVPTRDDIQLLINTILHTKAVINLASSMVFDYAVFNKPCLYLNYHVANKADESWSPQKVYNFVHFRSMPTGDEVIWLNAKEEIGEKLNLALSGATKNVKLARIWFDKINSTTAITPSKRKFQIFTELKLSKELFYE